MAQTAKIFMNGRSQAVRLPKEFRFEGAEVAIRRGDTAGEVVLTPHSAAGKLSRRKKPVRSEENVPTSGMRKLSLDELYAIFDQADFPEGFFKREVHMPRKLDLF